MEHRERVNLECQTAFIYYALSVNFIICEVSTKFGRGKVSGNFAIERFITKWSTSDSDREPSTKLKLRNFSPQKCTLILVQHRQKRFTV